MTLVSIIKTRLCIGTINTLMIDPPTLIHHIVTRFCELALFVLVAELELFPPQLLAYEKLESHMLDTPELDSLVLLLVIQVHHVFTILTFSEKN